MAVEGVCNAREHAAGDNDGERDVRLFWSAEVSIGDGEDGSEGRRGEDD